MKIDMAIEVLCASEEDLVSGGDGWGTLGNISNLISVAQAAWGAASYVFSDAQKNPSAYQPYGG